ncbi:MAG: lasso peptide biosynthesis B2 protein [Armatimonadota bacterium]
MLSMPESLRYRVRRLCATLETGMVLLAACAVVRLRAERAVAIALRPAPDAATAVPQALVRSQWVSVRRCHARVHRGAEALPGEVTCLPRALALFWLLRRRGIPAALRVGVCKEEGALLAHAWVELHGIAVGEAGGVPGRYRAFPAVPAPRAEPAP